MYLCGPGKHNCQPFCGPEGRFYCSDSVCSLWPAPFSYLCVSVIILCVLKTVCGWTSKNWLLPYACCGLHFIDSAACVLSFDHSTPLHQNKVHTLTVKWYTTITIQHSVWEARHTQRLALKQSVWTFAWGALSSRNTADKVISSSLWIQLSFYSTQYLNKLISTKMNNKHEVS